jgi:hypothetical protein
MNLYISWLNEQNIGFHMNPQMDFYGSQIPNLEKTDISSIVFIDDLNFFTDNESNLEKMIQSYTKFLSSYNMKLNIGKSYVTK